MNDPAIRVPDGQRRVEIFLTQNHMNGLNALLHWCEGFSAGGHGAIPGHFELIMHHRAIRNALINAKEDE